MSVKNHLEVKLS